MTMFFTTDTIADAVVDRSTPSSEDFSFDGDTMVTVDNEPWTRAFDTDSFGKFTTVVARPIEQTYVIDGEQHTFKKPADELAKAAWSLDNTPYPLTHPETKVVTSVDDVHGFHKNPRYVEDYDENGDALITDLYVPANDDQARQFITDNRAVSVGVYNDLQWDVDEDGIDAYQTNLYFDHVAGVRRGRCSLEDGCGLMTDAVTVRTSANEYTSMLDKTEAREARNEYRYETKQAAREAAEELNCADVDDPIHSHETDSGTIYMPCEDHGTFRQAFGRERGDEFTYDCECGVTVDVGSSQRDAIKTIRDEHKEMDSSEITPNMSTLVKVYRRGAAAWEDSHASGASQQQWALARVKEFLRDLRNGNPLSSGADNDLAPDGYSPPSGSQSPDNDSLGTVIPMCSDGPCSCGMHVVGDAEIGDTTIDLTVPDSAQSAAQAFLDAKSNGLVGSDCGTGVGTTSAKMIADGEVTAKRLVQDIAPYLSRHEQDTTREDHPNQWPDDAWTDCGDAQYAAWGWHSLKQWAFRTADKIKKARGEQPTYDSKHDEYTESATHSMMSVAGVTFKDTHDGKLDESAIPNDDYESHYLYARETKSDSSYPVVDADNMLRRGNVESAHKLGARGGVDESTHERKLSKLAEQFDDLQFDADSDSTMTDSDNNSDDIDFDGIVGGMTVDAVAEANEHVEQLREDAAERADRIDVLEEKVESLEADLDDAEEKLKAFEEGEREPKSAVVDSIREYTEAWDENELMDLDRAELDRRLEVAQDAVQSPSTPSDEQTNDSDENGGADKPDLNEHRTWRD